MVSGLKDLSVDARVSGGLRSPKLAVSSNLDRAIADRLQAVIGEEVAKAEKMVRAKVDSAVAERVEPVRKQILAVRSEAETRLGLERKQVEDVERELQARAQAAQRRTGTRHQASQDRDLRVAGTSGRFGCRA